MKITNPSVTLKDGLWYGYTVEVPEEPDYCTMTECDPYELCGCRKNKIYYEESLDSANASLVEISNQEEVEKYVRIVNAWEAYKTTDKWNPKPGAIYNLDGYVMEVVDLCFPTERIAAISPIQKHNTSMKTIYIDSLGTIKACTKEVPETLQQIKDTAVEFEDQELIFHVLWYQTNPKISRHDFKSSLKRDTFYCVEACWDIVEQRWTGAALNKNSRMPDWVDTSKADRFYEMDEKRRVARLVAEEPAKAAPDNQEELWNDVFYIMDLTHQNRAIEMLKDKFTITRNP